MKIKVTAILILSGILFFGCDSQERRTEKEIKQPEKPSVQEAGITPEEQAQVQREATMEEKRGLQIPVQIIEPKEDAPDTGVIITAQYVGVKRCKACHMKQYKSWKETNMAQSFNNLKQGVMPEEKKKAGLDPDRDYTHDKDCLRCHTTGYGKAGGFISIEETPKLIDVQCEACHGPGSGYSAIMKKNKNFKLAEVKAAGLLLPNETTNNCMECHGDDSPFNEKLDPKYTFEIKDRLKNTHKHFPLKYKH
jgi:mono/diheme cytochrome c family protein